jgi:hypothetical protein
MIHPFVSVYLMLIKTLAWFKLFPIAERGAKSFGVFRVKNHDFMPKNHIFSNFRGGTCGVRPPLDPPLPLNKKSLAAIGKNKIFWRKIVIFHTKYPYNFRAFLHRRNFF